MNKYIAINRFKIAIGTESDFEDIRRNRETHLFDARVSKNSIYYVAKPMKILLCLLLIVPGIQKLILKIGKNPMRLEKPRVVVAPSRYLFSPS